MQLQNIQITGGLTFIPEILTPAGDPYWANVSLLMNTTSTNNQTNNTFLDSSTNNFDITRNGTVTQGSFTPFTVAPNTSYNPSVNGGSAYFPGSATNNLTAGTTSSFNFLHNSSALFTAEFWIYRIASTDEIIFSNNNGASASIGAAVYFFSGNRIRLFITRGVSASPVCQVTSLSSIPLNTWTHVAITYNQSLANGNAKIYINGVLDVTGDKAGTAPSNSNATTVLNIGGAATNWLNGYLSSFRIVNSEVYSSNFTPSTTPLTAISGTSLLLNFTNAGVFDGTTKNNLTTLANAAVSTTQAKFGLTSVNGDNLVLLPSSGFDFSTGDFTVEGWVYFNSLGGLNYAPVFHNQFLFYVGAAGQMLLFNGTTNVATGTNGSITTGGWVHLAWVRSSSIIKMFVNGVQTGANATVSSSIGSGSSVGIGVWTTIKLNGFVQDVRITKGVARYTAAFTPPTAPFPTN